MCIYAHNVRSLNTSRCSCVNFIGNMFSNFYAKRNVTNPYLGEVDRYIYSKLDFSSKSPIFMTCFM